MLRREGYLEEDLLAKYRLITPPGICNYNIYNGYKEVGADRLDKQIGHGLSARTANGPGSVHEKKIKPP